MGFYYLKNLNFRDFLNFFFRPFLRNYEGSLLSSTLDDLTQMTGVCTSWKHVPAFPKAKPQVIEIGTQRVKNVTHQIIPFEYMENVKTWKQYARITKWKTCD